MTGNKFRGSRCSARLRNMNESRSSSNPVSPRSPATTTWRKAGITSRAAAPGNPSSTGTSRHADYREALLAGECFELPAHRVRLLPLTGQEGYAAGVPIARGQVGVEGGPEEPVRDLHKHTRSVTGLRVSPLGPPVLEVAKAGQAHLDHRVGGPAPQVGHEGDAARVVLELRPVEARARFQLRPRPG